jgi:hypothetical protein
MSGIPAAGAILVPDAPKISNLEFMKQVIENVKAQMQSVEQEVNVASHSQIPKVIQRKSVNCVIASLPHMHTVTIDKNHS